jgi:transposase-like protein
MAAQRREVKLSFRELHVSCPHCHAALTIGTVMDTILMSLRTCPKCGKEFVIENEIPRKPDAHMKKPSGSAKAARAGKRKSRF